MGGVPTRVLIVDDHPLVREALCARIGLRPDLEVCGEAADVDEALALLDAVEPDLMIIDLTLKRGHGLDLIKKTRQRSPDTKMLVVSAHEEELFAERVLRAGAAGYIHKQEAQHEVLDAIYAVLRGEHYVSESLAQHLLGKAMSSSTGSSSIDQLSNRELQVF
jgi:DNA-binding NarL/FixJ family response regulator